MIKQTGAENRHANEINIYVAFSQKQIIGKHSSVPRLPYIHKLNLSVSKKTTSAYLSTTIVKNHVPIKQLTFQVCFQEEQKVNTYIDRLRAFLPRIEQAILVERGITGDNFLSSLTLVKYDVMNIKATLRHFVSSIFQIYF